MRTNYRRTCSELDGRTPDNAPFSTGRAAVELEEAEIAPLAPISFHSLRRTYASLRCVCDKDFRYAADQLGHDDPRFTLRVYAQASKRRDRLTGLGTNGH